MPKLTRVNNIIPNLNAVEAFYDTSSFFVQFNKIRQKDLNNILSNPSHHIEDFKTLSHELRHSIDHIATLWGQKDILQYLKALNAKLELSIEQFPEIISYLIKRKQTAYLDYFTEYYNKVHVRNRHERWKWQATTGIGFNHEGIQDEKKPIPMIKFNSSKDIPIVRIPISIAALLETNAVFEETGFHSGYISTLPDVEKAIELGVLNDKIFASLYNEKLALYNVAVHLTANVLGLTEINHALKISSSIATLALNLPNNLVKKIPLKTKRFTTWGERNNYMLTNNEYGFIFFLILENYSDTFKQKKEFDIEDVLQASGLPTYKELKKIIELDMQNIYDEASTYPNLKEIILPKLKAGLEIFKTSGIASESLSIYEIINTMYKPDMVFLDTDFELKEYSRGEVFDMKPIKKLPFSEWYSISEVLNETLDEFFDIRGI